MPKYILLANFTDQGIRNIRGTISRAEAFQAMAEKSGIVMKELCWTLGPLRCRRGVRGGG